MEYFIHVANVLFLISYLVRDILWLRVLTVVAGATLMPYYFGNDLMAPILWNILFTAINVREIIRLLLERRPVQLDPRQEALYKLSFAALTPREFLKLTNAGVWHTEEAHVMLLEQGQELEALRIIYEGAAEVFVDGQPVATLGPGRFVGEMSYMTGDATCAAVATSCPTTYIAWEREGLDLFLEKNAPIHAALQRVFGTDLAAKLRQA